MTLSSIPHHERPLPFLHDLYLASSEPLTDTRPLDLNHRTYFTNLVLLDVHSSTLIAEIARRKCTPCGVALDTNLYKIADQVLAAQDTTRLSSDSLLVRAMIEDQGLKPQSAKISNPHFSSPYAASLTTNNECTSSAESFGSLTNYPQQKKPIDIECRPKKSGGDDIKLPEDAFIVFCRQCHEERQLTQKEVATSAGGCPTKKWHRADLSEATNQQWKALTPDEQLYFEELRREKKKEHEQMCPNCVYGLQRSSRQGTTTTFDRCRVRDRYRERASERKCVLHLVLHLALLSFFSFLVLRTPPPDHAIYIPYLTSPSLAEHKVDSEHAISSAASFSMPSMTTTNHRSVFALTPALPPCQTIQSSSMYMPENPWPTLATSPIEEIIQSDRSPSPQTYQRSCSATYEAHASQPSPRENREIAHPFVLQSWSQPRNNVSPHVSSVIESDETAKLKRATTASECE